MFRYIIAGLEAELGEALVVAHQLGNRPLELSRDRFKRGARRRLFQIFDSVELDTAGV